MQSVSLFVIAAGLAVSCTEPQTEPEQNGLDAPTGLRTGTITATTASFAWTAGGVADSYNVVIGEEEPVAVNYHEYLADNLTAETSYTWKVQAVRGDQVSAWVEGPAFTTPEEGVTVVPPPTDLKVEVVTHNAAKFSCKFVGVDALEVSINDGEPIPMLYGYDLTPETTYSWKVRTGKNGVWSEWAQGEDFTTRKDTGNTQFLEAIPTYYADYYEIGAEMFVMDFVEITSGIYNRLQLRVCFSEQELGMESGKQWLDLPNRTYTHVENESMAIDKFNAWLSDYTVESGSMTVQGDHATGYHITLDINYNGGTISAEYNGPVYMPNPKYPPAGNPVDFGVLDNTATMFGGTLGNVDAWLLQAHSSGIYVDETGHIMGEGWWLMCQIHSPAGSGEIMPDGTYNIGTTYTVKPWSVLSRGQNRMFVNETGKRTLYVTSGTLKSTYSDGKYTVIVDGKTDNGTVVTGTAKVVPKSPYASYQYSPNRWRTFDGMTDVGIVTDIVRPDEVLF